MKKDYLKRFGLITAIVICILFTNTTPTFALIDENYEESTMLVEDIPSYGTDSTVEELPIENNDSSTEEIPVEDNDSSTEEVPGENNDSSISDSFGIHESVKLFL